MKKIFVLILVFLSLMCQGQIYYTPQYTPIEYFINQRFHRLRLPNDTAASAETGEAAYVNGQLYIKSALGYWTASGGGGGGANNYTTQIEYGDNTLTLHRSGLSNITASWDSSKYHSIGYYNGHFVRVSDTAAMLANYLRNITGHITAGANVTITGDGTLASPYIIGASGEGGSTLFSALGDVNLSGLANGQVAIYRTTDNKWHNETWTGLTGSGASGRIASWNGSNNLGSSSNLLFDGTTFQIGSSGSEFAVDAASGQIRKVAGISPGNGQMLIGYSTTGRFVNGSLTAPNAAITVGYSYPNVTLNLDTTKYHSMYFYDTRYTGGGGADGNNYPTDVAFSNNQITIQRNGLGNLTATWDSAKYHSVGYYDTRYSPDGNNYPSGISYSDNTLTMQRTGLGNLTATWDSTKYHSVGYYDTRYGTGAILNGNSGSGLKLLYHGTQDLRTIYGDYAMSWDTTTNATGLTVKVDTTLMATRAYANGYGGGGAPSRGDSTINVSGTAVSFRDYVNVKTHGAKGNGVDNDKTAFQNAAAEAVAEGRPLFMPPGQYKITGGLDLSGVTVAPAPGAYFKGNTGSWADSIENFTLDADVQQKVFDTTITVHKMKPSSGVFSVLNFGAVADALNTSETGTTDNYNAFRRAMMAMYNDLPTGNGYYYSGILYIPRGIGSRDYYISKTLYIGGNIEIIGEGMHSTVLQWPRGVVGMVLSNISYGNTAQYANPQGQQAKRVIIRDIQISGYKGQEGYFPGYYDGTSHGIIIYSGEGKLENVHLTGWQGDGVRCYGGNNVRFDNVVSEYNSGNGFHFMTADGNASILNYCMARWNGRNGFYDESFLGNLVFAPNAESNGGHNLYNQTAIIHSGKYFFCKKDVVWRVTHNGHHYTCIQAHYSQESNEPGTGGGASYWTDNGVGVWTIGWPNWEDFQNYLTAPIEPEITTGWATYYEQTIDFAWQNITWNDTTAFYAGGPYDIEGPNQTGLWLGLYTEFDQILGRNNSSSFVGFGNGGTIIPGWSQKLQGGYSIFQHVVAQDPDNQRWWATVKGKGLTGVGNGFGWYNSITGAGHWLTYDSSTNYVTLQNVDGFDIPYLRALSITNSGTYLGTGKFRIYNIASSFSETVPGTGTGTLHIDPVNAADQQMGITFGAQSNLNTAEAGLYVYQSGSYGTRLGLATTNNFATGAQIRFFLKENGSAKFNAYGSGTFTGTATKWLAVTSSGDLIEENPPSGAGLQTLTIQSPLTGGSYNGSSPVTIGLDTSAGKWRSEGYYDTKYAPIGGGGGGAALTEKYIGYGSASNLLTGTADIQREAEGFLTLKNSSGNSSYLKLNNSITNSGAFLEGEDSTLMIWSNGIRRVWVRGVLGTWISRNNPQTMSSAGEYDLQIGSNAYIPNLVTSTSLINNGTYLGTSTLTMQGLSADWNETTPGLTTGGIHLKPTASANHGGAITWGGQGHLTEGQAGIYVRSDGGYGTKMYLATTDNFDVGSKTRLFINSNSHIGINNVTADSMLQVTGSGHFTGRLRVEQMDSTQTPVNLVYQDVEGTLRKTSTSKISLTGTAAAPATSGTMTPSVTNLSAITITPSGDCTFNSSTGVAGQRIVFVVTTSGTTSYTLTWGENYKTTGTLATGTADAKVFTVSFITTDGTYWYETGRTPAM